MLGACHLPEIFGDVRSRARVSNTIHTVLMGSVCVCVTDGVLKRSFLMMPEYWMPSLTSSVHWAVLPSGIEAASPREAPAPILTL